MTLKKLIKFPLLCMLFSCKIIYRFLENVFNKVTYYPNTIQMPITYKCNFDCVMCGMHKLINKNDISCSELEKVLEDKLFRKIENIGLNGGEPFIRKDLIECVEIIMKKLPRLKSISIISNGYFTDEIVTKLKIIKEMCKQNGIKLYVSFSLDGVGEMQDFHRGHKNSYKMINNTLNIIMKDINKYADNVYGICTITKYNIAKINEVEAWAEKTNLKMLYNIATINKRIENEEKVNDFSIFADEHARMLAQEFFYKKYYDEKNEKYYAIYLFIKEKKRYDICPCMYNYWITLSPNAEISFCATHSKELGSALKESAYSIVKNNVDYLLNIRKEYCANCSHYISNLNIEGLIKLLRERIKNEYYF